jgi:hypothetical protein
VLAKCRWLLAQERTISEVGRQKGEHMSTRFVVCTVVLALAVALMLGGCGKKAGQDAAAGNMPSSPAEVKAKMGGTVTGKAGAPPSAAPSKAAGTDAAGGTKGGKAGE